MQAQRYLALRDSFKQVLAQAPDDSTRTRTLYKIAHTYRNQAPKAGLPYALEGMKIAENLEDTAMIAQHCLILAILNQGLSALDSAKIYAQRGLTLLHPYQTTKSKGSLHLVLADILRMEHQLSQAAHHDSMALTIFEEIQDTIQIAASYINLGNLSLMSSKSLNALEYYYLGYQLYRSQEFVRGQIVAANNMGWTFFQHNNFADATNYLGLAEELAIKDSLFALAAGIKSNLAQVYFHQGKLEKAVEKSAESIKIGEAIDAPSSLYEAKKLMAEVLFAQGFLLRSALLNQEVETYYRQTAGKVNLVGVLCLKSKILLEKSKFSAALVPAEEALQIAREIQHENSLKKALSALAYYYEKVGIPSQALKHQKELQQLTDESHVLEIARLSQQLHNGMEVGRLEAQALRLEREKALKEEALVKSESLLRMQSFIFVISIILLTIVFAFAFYLYKQNQFSKSAVQKLSDQAKALDQAKQEIEAASEEKNRFFSMISHEIRTPLNAIMGMTHLLANSKGTKKQREQISILEYSANSLLTLVNDLLDFNKLESGMEVLDERSFNLPATCQRIIKSYLPQAQKKGLDLRLSYAETLPHEWIGDSLRIGQIISNLLTNAIKFTQRGMIHLKIGGSLEQGLEISVVDTGIGIPKEKAQSIFEEFNQADYQLGKALGGVGLGLPIAQKLAKAMGGEITVQSQLGLGSTFTCRLPLRGIELSPSVHTDNLVNEFSSQNGTVLVAEDHLVNQKVVQTFLENWGYRVIIANNGREALDQLQHDSTIEVVLMDLQMPVLDGLEASKIIRSSQDRPWQNIPIIAFTASVIPQDFQRLKGEGVTMILTKPIDPPVLREAIRRAQQMGRSSSNAEPLFPSSI